MLTGDALVNHIYSGGGNDLVRGGGGVDLLVGGTGADTLDYRDEDFTVSLTLSLGVNAVVRVDGVVEDTVREFESVFGGSAGDTLTGDGAANLFRGGGGFDVMNGFGGADTVDFRDKTVSVALTLAGSAIVNATVGGVLEDSIRNVENILGGTAADDLRGDALINRLTGGGGADELRGGGGGDVFVYAALADSTVLASGRDNIRDFSSGQGDKIDLSLIDANSAPAGDQAFTLGALGVAGRLAVSTVVAGSVYLVQGDVNGGGADFAIAVYATTAPIAADFLL